MPLIVHAARPGVKRGWGGNWQYAINGTLLSTRSPISLNRHVSLTVLTIGRPTRLKAQDAAPVVGATLHVAATGETNPTASNWQLARDESAVTPAKLFEQPAGGLDYLTSTDLFVTSQFEYGPTDSQTVSMPMFYRCELDRGCLRVPPHVFPYRAQRVEACIKSVLSNE